MPAAGLARELKPKDKCRPPLYIQTQEAVTVSGLFARTVKLLASTNGNQYKALPPLARSQSSYSMDISSPLNTVQTYPIHMTNIYVHVLMWFWQVGTHLHSMMWGTCPYPRGRQEGNVRDGVASQVNCAERLNLDYKSSIVWFCQHSAEHVFACQCQSTAQSLQSNLQLSLETFLLCTITLPCFPLCRKAAENRWQLFFYRNSFNRKQLPLLISHYLKLLFC